ncbi:MAG: phenylalanine--tRNA ligase subunit beta [Candidatus Omnitrophica bacterium]|nr:phenylalanine--tRNA ligase subunit beta [Candidatus Omnitrophota bacterium]
MKVSLTWLEQYIDIKIPIKTLVDKLTDAGLEVGAVEKVNNDTVFEIEITSNRPDWLSLLGIAREVAAVTGTRKIIQPDALPQMNKSSKQKKSYSIEIQDKAACPRYVGRLIRDVQIAPSQENIKTYLENIGSRLINNAADITNYCLYETGQPMHVFDFDKIKGAKIIVRRAKKGETITTIDGVNRKLDESILVIADAEKPIAIAGIMGGLDTEVTDFTKNILLESAYFDPVTIRRGSRKLGLSTESNYRFERKVDTGNIVFASCRAAYLLQDICKGKVESFYLDVNYLKDKVRKVDIQVEHVERLIGIKVSTSKIKSILLPLGFKVANAKKKNTLTVTVPSFRTDVSIEEDLIEEIARVEGFSSIIESLPPIQAHINSACTDQYMAKTKISNLLLGQGINEIITLTLMSTKNLDDAFIPADKRVILINPLSIEQEALRTSLLPSTLKVINTNLNRKVKDLKVFEIGNIYEKATNKFLETESVAIALTGNAYQNWKDHNRKVSFYDLKGIVENVLDSFGVDGNCKLEAKVLAYFDPEQSAVITVDNKVIAELGKVNKKVTKNYDISEPVYFAQLNIADIVSLQRTAFRYNSVPKYPSVNRDIALVVDKLISAQSALDIIKQVAGALAVKIELFDLYTGDQVPDNKKSLAFSIEYQSSTATLTEEEVSKVHNNVQDALLSKLGASLR